MAVSRTLLVALAALLCFAQVLHAGMVKRSTETGSSANQLQEAANTAQQVWANVSQTLGLDSLPSAETVASNLHEQSLNFARSLGEFVGQLQNQAQTHQGELSGVLQSVATRWNETATNLQAQNPEVTRTAEEVKNSFRTGLEAFWTEAQKLMQSVSNHTESAGTDLQQMTRTVLDNFAETANTFKTTLQQTTANHQ